MLKILGRLESVVENRIGHFMTDHDCDVDIAIQMCNHFIKMLSDIKAQAEAKKAEIKTNLPVMDEVANVE